MKKADTAIALKYNPELPAPFLVAKGKGELALKLLRIAEEHNIEIVAQPDLSNALFEFEAGSFIPEEMYEIIAELLAYVYKVRNLT
ncbi:MAG: flagellar biosynthesis protein FlhB [Spirochaetales bacterium]|jgi:flagellar biosynthesis protein FlhB|nr:flagellar biosynthesis protein FlhB [Spirochaetales bacterium]